MYAVLETLHFVYLEGNPGPLSCDFGLEGLLILEEHGHKLCQTRVQRIQVLELLVHLVGLSLHGGNLVFPGGDIFFEFFDLVVKDVLEFFKLLGFLFEFINLLLVVVDCFISLLNDHGLVFNLFLKHFIRLFQPQNLSFIFLLLVDFAFPLLFFLLDFLICDRNITIGPQSVLRYILMLLGVVICDLLHLFVFLFFNLPHRLFVLFLQSLDLSFDIHLLVMFGFNLLFEVFFHFLQVLFVLLSVSFNLGIEVFGFLFLGSLEFIILGTFLHDILGLV